jgi:hypothetical protein
LTFTTAPASVEGVIPALPASVRRVGAVPEQLLRET